MTAEDYFCPVLSIISDRLSLSPEVAGITILALGNGFFSSFSFLLIFFWFLFFLSRFP